MADKIAALKFPMPKSCVECPVGGVDHQGDVTCLISGLIPNFYDNYGNFINAANNCMGVNLMEVRALFCPLEAAEDG